MCITKEATFDDLTSFFLHFSMNIFLILYIFFFYTPSPILCINISSFYFDNTEWILPLRIYMFFFFFSLPTQKALSTLVHFKACYYVTIFCASCSLLPTYKSYSGTDIKLALLNGFLVMHVHKASFTFSLDFCFPLVTHFAASVFIL